MSSTDTITGISEAEALYICRGLTKDISRGVSAFDWIRRRWPEVGALLRLPGLLQHFIEVLGPAARANIDAGEPDGFDLGDARAANRIERLLCEARFAPILTAIQVEPATKALPSRLDGQGSPETVWMTVAGRPPYDVSHTYQQEEKTHLAELFCELNPTRRGEPRGGVSARQLYRERKLLPHLPDSCWPIRTGQGGRPRKVSGQPETKV